MARSPYAQHDRLRVVDVEPPQVVVQGAGGAPPSRARCIWAGDRPPLARGDTRVAPGAREGPVYERSEYQPAPGQP